MLWRVLQGQNRENRSIRLIPLTWYWASEVKSLANQTAQATDEIRSQIANMQQVTTTAVGAIRNIGLTIGEIDTVTTAIAAAVEQQGAATREIARNIQHAAGGTSEVSGHIVGVS